MREITKYVANDGKEFDDEYECREYEIKVESKLYENTLYLYDRNGNRYSTTEMNDFYDFDYITIIVIKSKGAYDWLSDAMYDYYGLDIMSREEVEKENYNCAFFYDDDIDEWVSCKERIDEYKKEIEKLSKYVVDNE